MTVTEDIGAPPMSREPTEWLDYLLTLPNRYHAIEGVIEDYPHQLAEILNWALNTRDRLERACAQAGRHLADDTATPDPCKPFWQGVQAVANPFGSLPAPSGCNGYTWQPGDPF